MQSTPHKPDGEPLIERLLDENCRGCQPEHAKLTESISTEQSRDQEKSPGWQCIRPYSPEIGELLEKNSRARAAHPIGEGDFFGEALTIEGYEFHYGQSGTWEYEGVDCNISIRPNADKADTTSLLQKFRTTHELILTRGIAGGKVSVEIGNGQPLKKTTRLADAIACDYLIRFPVTKNGSHLAAVCAEKGANISLQAVILHEVGHLLETKLTREIGWLSRTLQKNLVRCQEALNEISPHYLGKQAAKVATVLGELDKMENDGRKSIVVEGETWEPYQYRNHLIDSFSHELAAEMIRDFYLEPALAGCLRTKTTCGWPEFDGLQTILRREAKHTLGKSKVGTPVFPKERRNPKQTLGETIQEFLD